MIPHREKGALRLTRAVARRCAEDRAWASGYTLLLHGLGHARDLAKNDTDWAGELIHLYRRSIDDYCLRYAVRVGPDPRPGTRS